MPLPSHDPSPTPPTGTFRAAIILAFNAVMVACGLAPPSTIIRLFFRSRFPPAAIVRLESLLVPAWLARVPVSLMAAPEVAGGQTPGMLRLIAGPALLAKLVITASLLPLMGELVPVPVAVLTVTLLPVIPVTLKRREPPLLTK